MKKSATEVSDGAGRPLPKKISEAEIKDALLRSGYLLEYRVENFLRHRRWFVEANCAYRDVETQKSRELDIYATRVFGLEENAIELFGSVAIECVNNLQPIAFITKEDRYAFTFTSDIKQLSGPTEIEFSCSKTSLADFLNLDEVHHYCSGRIATQFCSFSPKDKGRPSEWVALHETTYFDSFTSLIKAVEHKIAEGGYAGSGGITAEILYPVLVIQGEMLDVRHVDGELQLIPIDHIKFRRSVIWENRETGYTIDVTTERNLDNYFDLIEGELSVICDRMKENVDVLKNAEHL